MAYFFPWLLAPIIIFALILVNYFLMIKKSTQKKSSIYECGFTPKFSARLPFSLRFFLLALLFLIFDVELVLVIIFPLSSFLFSSMVAMLMFCIFLFLGLLHEWNEGSLSWVQ